VPTKINYIRNKITAVVVPITFLFSTYGTAENVPVIESKAVPIFGTGVVPRNSVLCTRAFVLTFKFTSIFGFAYAGVTILFASGATL
jgi:hypothetical protein